MAELASLHLQRLTTGRIRQITWAADHGATQRETSIHADVNDLLHDLEHVDGFADIALERRLPQIDHTDLRTATRLAGSVRVDGRTLSHLTHRDAQIVMLAIRMAAIDRLATLDVEAPLVVDERLGVGGRDGDAWLPALRAFADKGRQVILLTTNRNIAARVGRWGGLVQSIAPTAYDTFDYGTTHTHRPLTVQRRDWETRVPDDVYHAPPNGAPVVNDRPDRSYRDVINRNFDNAYAEYQSGRHDVRVPVDFGATISDMPYTDGRRSEEDRHARTILHDPNPDLHTSTYDNGFVRTTRFGREPVAPARPNHFLTADSPIDHAPSIDAVAAARLRGVGINRIGQLVHADAEALALQMRLADVDAIAVGRWQDEAQLMCDVPRLRSFDARVMVGCGIESAGELASIDTADLLRRVEAFISTSRGRQVLRTGSSYELSRLTSWIAAANAGEHAGGFGLTSRRRRVLRSQHDEDGRGVRRRRKVTRVRREGGGETIDADGYTRRSSNRSGSGTRGSGNESGVGRGNGAGRGTGRGSGNGGGGRRGVGHGQGNGSGAGYGRGSGSGNARRGESYNGRAYGDDDGNTNLQRDRGNSRTRRRTTTTRTRSDRDSYQRDRFNDEDHERNLRQ
ncbi:MAG: DUF4332 domain-containing protein, partial [Planctomycetota bacterium]